MPTPLVALRLPDDLVNHYDALAERLGSDRTKVMRAALEEIAKKNPVEGDELARVRAKKGAGKSRVTLAADGTLREGGAL